MERNPPKNGKQLFFIIYITKRSVNEELETDAGTGKTMVLTQRKLRKRLQINKKKELRVVLVTPLLSSRRFPSRRKGGREVLRTSDRRARLPRGPSAGLLRALRPPALQFAVHSVGVLAAAAGPVDPVVAALAGLQAPFDGRVAQQTGEEYRH